MAAPEAPEAWIAPNNPSLTNQIRFALDSLRQYLKRMATFTSSISSYLTDRAVPIGTVRMTVCPDDEDGWKELDGDTMINAQTLFPTLWSKVPTSWKSGTNINLPDMREAVPKDGSAAAVGTFVGSNSVTLATGNLPSHTHGVNFVSGTENQAHNHNPGSGANFVNFTAFAGAQNFAAGGNLFPTSATTNTENQAHNHNINGTSDATGSGTPIDTTPASMYLKFVIRIS